jgi:elongation factor 1-beta
MTLKFGDITSKAGAKAINDYLADRSYIDGYVPTSTDLAVLKVLKSAPALEFAHFLRWYNHIKSYGNDVKVFFWQGK